MTGFTGELPPARLNMARYCLAPASWRPPSKTALLVLADAATPQPTEHWSFAALEDTVLRTGAALLSLGLRRGDRIVIRLENTSDYAILFFGAMSVGLVPLPASAALTADDIGFLLDDSDARAIVLSPDLPAPVFRPGLTVLDRADIRRLRKSHDPAAYADTAAGDPAFLVYTSGTTARPKGVLHAHRSVWGRRPMYRGWYGISPADRMLHAGAFNWTYTLGTGLSDPWANGATALVYTGEKDPAVWPRLAALHRATMFAAVPSVYRQILKYGEPEACDLAALRHGLTAGEHLSEPIATEWRDRTGTWLYEALGMSEISTYISSSPDTPVRAGSVGKPQPGRCVEILPLDGGTEPVPRGESGLIGVHRTDPGLMLRYWNRDDEQAQVFRDQWFLGGDIGTMDEDGYITHLGRNDDMMNAFGYRVSPQEIEQTLARQPGIAEIAVTEIQVREDVSVIGAFIVPEEHGPRDARSIRAFAEQTLAGYKVPREYVFVDALPRTPNGKVRRAELQAAYAAGALNPATS